MSRIAFVFDRLGVTVERLVRAAATDGEVVLVSDGRSPRVEGLAEELDAELFVAEHRMVDVGDGWQTSDVILASRLAASHASRPLDAVVYATDALVDFAWHEPALGAVPKGRALVGILAKLGEIWEDSGRFADLGHRAVALAGDAATADFVFAIPSRLNGDLLPASVDVSALFEAKGDFLALDVRGLVGGEAAAAVAARADAAPGMVLAVGSDLHQGRALQRLLPPPLAGRVIFAREDDPWCRELITASAETAELFAAIPDVRTAPSPVVFRGDDLTELRDLLADLHVEQSPAAVAVAGDGVWESPFGRTPLADLGFVAAPAGPLGDLDPSRIRDDVVVIGPRARPVALDAIGVCDDLRALVYRMTEPALISSAVVSLVPGDPGATPLGLRTRRSPYDLGSRLYPALLPIPNAPAEEAAAASDFDPVEWVGSKTWATRWRLALPFRWGLLSRAMRGRW